MREDPFRHSGLLPRTLSLPAKQMARLKRIKDILDEMTGVEHSYSNAVEYLLNFYDKKLKHKED